MLWMIALGDRPGAPGRRAPLRLRAARPRGVVDGVRQRPEPVGARARVGRAAGDGPRADAARLAQPVRARARGVLRRPGSASDGRIVPGHVVPTNVDVPRADYLLDVRILSLAGWRPYEGPRSLVEPMQRYFLDQAAGHYPALRGKLDPAWIYEAAVEGLGLDPARAFLDELARRRGRAARREGAAAGVSRAARREYREPLALAVRRRPLRGLAAQSPKATPAAPSAAGPADAAALRARRARGARALPPLSPDVLRRRTARGRGSAFDRLLQRLFERKGEAATRMVELSELQSALDVRRGPARVRRAGLPPHGVAAAGASSTSPPGGERVFVLSQVSDGRGAPFRRSRAGRPRRGRASLPAAVRVGARDGARLAPAGAARRGGARRRAASPGARRRRASRTSRAS